MDSCTRFVTVLEGHGDGFADTLQGWHSVIAEDFVHWRWQVHGKKGKRSHGSIEEQNVFVKLYVVLKALASGQVEGFVLVDELMEGFEALGKFVRFEKLINDGFGGRPCTIWAAGTFAKFDCTGSGLVFVEEGDL